MIAGAVDGAGGFAIHAQEALGLTWRLYADHAARGEIVDDALLVHAYKLRAIDLGRHVALCDGGQPKRDVFDIRNYIAGRVEVLRFGNFDDEDETRGPDEEDAPVGFGLAEATSRNPLRRILFAISLNEWLATLSTDDRELIELRAAGFDLAETAGRLNTSKFVVCRRIKELGEELAKHAGLPDSVHRRKLRRTRASEEAVPESGVRSRKRGRPKKAQAALLSARGMRTRRVQRVA